MTEGYGENGGGGHYAHHDGHSHGGGGGMLWWFGLLGFKYPLVVVFAFVAMWYYNFFFGN